MMISTDQGHYDKKTLFKYLVLLGLWTALWKVTQGYIVAVMPIYLLILIAQKKSVEVLFWVLTLIVSSIGNPLIYPSGSVVMLVMRLTLLSISIFLVMRIAGKRVPVFIRPLLGILFYIAWEALVSMQGYSPVISYLKLLLFVPLYLTVYAIACDVTTSPQADAKQIHAAVLAISILLIGGSMVLLGFPSIGQMVAMRQVMEGGDAAEIVQNISAGESTSLFCGMCIHSQALGPVIALMSVLVFSDYVFGLRRKDWIYFGLLLSCPILIYKTSCRTAMGAYLAGMGMALFLFMQARTVGQRWKGRVLMSIFALGVLSLVALMFVPDVRERALKFALKFSGQYSSTRDLTMDRLTSSRQAAIETSLAGFRKKPLWGNGFQVGWWMARERRKGWVSYVSASIEKGVWPSAVLEEGGLIGFVLFAGFLFATIVTLIKRRAYCGVCVLWTFSFSNLGEFNFFTMSSIGGFGWAMVFAGLILDGQRFKVERLKG